MTRPPKVWVTRAQPGAARTAARLTQMGLEPVVVPLIEIRHLAPDLPDVSTFDGLVFTSRNGVEAVMRLAPPDAAPHLPVYTVGAATADAARQAGFARVYSADGDVEALADLIRAEAPDTRLLHLGAHQPAGDLAGALVGMSRITGLPVYEAVATNLAPPEDFDVVLIHSPRAARELAVRLALGGAAGRIAAAISPAAATPLNGLGFVAVHIAESPDEKGLCDAVQATLGKPPFPV